MSNMIVNIIYNNLKYICNLSSPIDISIPIKKEGVIAWNIPDINITPVKEGRWIGDIKKGGAVNFNNIFFNPHAHSTHTECIGHISPIKESINNELSTFFFVSKLITITPKRRNGDCIITKDMLSRLIKKGENIDALIIRTLPNEKNKLSKNYSNTNPPYLLKEGAQYLADINIKHLLIDLPSVDKESDGGLVNAHKSFWGFPENKRHGCTITELIYVSSKIKDGKYLLNLQFIPFENDASPSRPLLFKMIKEIDE